jgi:hypothetical protein
VQRARLLIEHAEALGEPPDDPLSLFAALYASARIASPLNATWFPTQRPLAASIGQGNSVTAVDLAVNFSSWIWLEANNRARPF